MSKDDSLPFWKSIRGVGQPSTHKYSRDHVELGRVPARDYTDVPLENSPRAHYVAPTPKCQRCGLISEADHYKIRFWCHYCWEEVKSPMSPSSMVPVPVEGQTTLKASISDPHMEMTCSKCMVQYEPLLDNSGFQCPSCKYIYRRPPMPRPSPQNGF